MTAPAQIGEPTMPADDPNQPGYGPPKILAAIWRVMKDVTFVAKASQYKEGRTEYKFRSIDDLARDLGTAFRTHGVFVQSEQLDFHSDRERTTNAGNKWTTVRVKIRYRFTSLEDGSTLTFEAWGEGADTSDKATMKAHTMALKAALGQAFLLPTDEKDPDAERPGDGDYSRPVGQGQGYDPNAAARTRQQAAREQARAQGVQPPEANGSREENVQAHIGWVQREIKALPDLVRLSYIYMITRQRQLLEVDAAGVPLGQRIKAEMSRFGIDPNRAMPTPEQAQAFLDQQAKGGQ
jgi:hypothetical protein